MTLLLSKSDVDGLIDIATAIEITAAVVQEQYAGTAVYMPPFGGAHSETSGLLRMVGGGLRGMGRMGVRLGLRGPMVALIYDMDTWDLLGIVGYPFSNLRVSASMALAARHLSQPKSQTIGLLGSGRNALDILQGLCAVRPIRRVEVYSPTAEHRNRFARRATEALGVPVTPHDAPEPVIAAADIIALATNAESSVLKADQLRPGVHVTSMGVEVEVDPSVYLRVDQIVASSVSQEIVANQVDAGGRPPTRLLERLLAEGKVPRDRAIDLGAIVAGDISPRNGPGDITLYRDSRGGVGDMALAHFAFERARALGRGVEFAFA